MSGETRYRLLSVTYTYTHEKNHPNGGFSPNFYRFLLFFIFMIFSFFLHTPLTYSSLLKTMHSFSSSHSPTFCTFTTSFL